MKKLVSLFLAFVMAFSMLAMPAFAEELSYLAATGDIWTNADWQNGINYGINSSASGVYELPCELVADGMYTVEFTLETSGGQRDTIIGLNKSSVMTSGSYFGNSTIMMKIDGTDIKVRNGGTTSVIGTLSDAKTTVDIKVDVDLVNNVWAVTFLEDAKVVATESNMSFRNEFLPIDSLVLADNSYVSSCLSVASDSLKITDIKPEYEGEITFNYVDENGTFIDAVVMGGEIGEEISIEEKTIEIGDFKYEAPAASGIIGTDEIVTVVCKTVNESIIWTNASWQNGIGYGVNNSTSGIYELPSSLTSDNVYTVEFSLETSGTQENTLIGLNTSSMMTRDNYFGNSTIMMKVDGTNISVRNGANTTTIGTLSNAKTTVDIKVDVNLVNNLWGVTFTENGEVVATQSNMSFRNNYLPINSIVLCDNNYIENCLFVDTASLKIVKENAEYEGEITFNYVDENGTLIDTVTIGGNIGEEISFAKKTIQGDSVKYEVPAVSGIVGTDEIVTVVCQRVYTVTITYWYDGYWYFQHVLEGVAGSEVSYDSGNYVIRNSNNTSTEDGIYRASGTVTISPYDYYLDVQLEPVITGLVSTPSYYPEYSLHSLTEPVVSTGKVSFSFMPNEPKDAIIGLCKFASLTENWFAQSSAYIQLMNDGNIYLNDGSGIVSKGVYSENTIYFAEFDLDLETDTYSVKITDGENEVLSVEDFNMRNPADIIDTFFLLDNGSDYYGSIITTDPVVETEENIWANTREQMHYIKGVNTAKTGIFKLPCELIEGRTYAVSFSVDTTGRQADTLIALNNTSSMTGGNHYTNSTIMMKIDGTSVKVRNGDTTTTIGTLSKAETTVDVKVEVDLINNKWGVTFTENETMVAQIDGLSFRNNNLPIDCMALCDNAWIIGSLFVDAGSLEIVDATPGQIEDVVFNYVDENNTIIDTVTVSGEVGSEVSVDSKIIDFNGSRYEAPEASGIAGTDKTVTVVCEKAYTVTINYILDGYIYDTETVEGADGSLVEYSSRIVIIDPKVYKSSGTLAIDANELNIYIELELVAEGHLSTPSIYYTYAKRSLVEPVVSTGKVTFAFTPIDPQDAIIAFSNNKFLENNYFAQSSAYIQLKNDGYIYMNDGNGAVKKGEYSIGTTYFAELDLDVERDKYSVTITDGDEVVVSVEDFDMRTAPDIIDAFINMDNATDSYGTVVVSDLKVETEENIWANACEQIGIKEINTAFSGVYELPCELVEGKTYSVSFTVDTMGAQTDTLIGLNNSEMMTHGDYFANSTIMMKIDGTSVKVRNGDTTTTVGSISKAKTTVDVKVDVNLIDNTWDVTFTENGVVIAERAGLSLRNENLPIDSLVLCDNGWIIGSLFVDADSLKIVEHSDEQPMISSSCDGGVLTVSLNNSLVPQGKKLIVAMYNNEGDLLGARSADVTAEENYPFEIFEDATYGKIIILDDIVSIKPFCMFEEVIITN